MARKKIDAFFWRKCNSATIATLLGESSGQYHIAFPDRSFDGFFKGINRSKPTELGGYYLSVPIMPFLGAPPVDAQLLSVHYMGDKSQRKDWNFQSQRPDTAYPLWRQGRGFVNKGSVGDRDFIVIARDIGGKFHARWIRSENFDALPVQMKISMQASDTGWVVL